MPIFHNTFLFTVSTLKIYYLLLRAYNRTVMLFMFKRGKHLKVRKTIVMLVFIFMVYDRSIRIYTSVAIPHNPMLIGIPTSIFFTGIPRGRHD